VASDEAHCALNAGRVNVTRGDVVAGERRELMKNGRLRAWWVIALLLTAGAALVWAFVVAPAALLSGRYGKYNDLATLQGTLASSLVEFWQGGTSTFPSSLAELVDYWFQWHAIKVAICAPMAVVLTLLAAALWSRYLRAGRRSAAWYLVGGACSTVSVALAVGLVVLNIQATSAPLVALLPLLPADAGMGPAELVREALSNGSNAQEHPAALSVLLDEVARYNWILALVSSVLTLACIAASIVSWRRCAKAGANAPRVRKMYITLGIVTALAAGALLFLSAVSTRSALNPSDALMGLLGIE